MSVLFVCTGNICRSPVAERILRSLLPDFADVEVSSAGTSAMSGHRIDETMAELLGDVGLDSDTFRARQITEEMADEAELIITMTREHRSHVVRLAPRTRDRCFTLLELVKLLQLVPSSVTLAQLATMRTQLRGTGEDLDIEDPYRRRRAVYVEVFDQIRSALAIVMAWLSGESVDAASSNHTVRVLESIPEPGPQTNPYAVMLLDELRRTPSLDVMTFDWKTALSGDYDVFHAHWPEILVNRPGVKGNLNRRQFAKLLRRIERDRIAVVRTVHNLRPHEPLTGSAAALLTRLDELTVANVAINDSTKVGPDDALILHGHFRDWYGKHPLPPSEPGRIAFVGLVRRYKGVDDLVRAFRATSSSAEMTLDIAGRCTDDDLRETLVEATAADPRIQLDLEFQSDAQFVDHVGRASVVAFPYRRLFNSGAVLAALSLSRVVLVPESDLTDRLAAEVGEQWVLRYEATITAADLTAAVTHAEAFARDNPHARPDLSAREWEGVGAAHRRLFARAAHLTKEG